MKEITQKEFEETLEKIICFYEGKSGDGEPREIIERYLKIHLK